MRIEAVRGDITRQVVDAIVNAANTQLAHGSGVCGAIFQAAGASDMARACAALGRCPTGDARATPGFGLPACWVIHAVGPIWRGGNNGERELLASAYRRSVEVADSIGANSIAFPAISTGIYGYPAAEAARVAVETLRSTPGRLEMARLVAFDAATLALYEGQLTS